MGAKRLVLFGAGMTGRGQVAQLAFEDSWELTLVDRDAGLVDRLRAAGSYRVRLLGETPREVVIGPYRALHSSESEALAEAIRQADLVVTSVLEPNLPAVGESLAAALATRLRTGAGEPLNVIAAENMEHSSADLRGYVLRQLAPDLAAACERAVGFPNSMISRVVPLAADPLCILTEAYSEWTADRHSRLGQPPGLAGLEWVEDQAARLQRKLYIHNTGHVICASLGWLAGYRYIHEAAADATILGHVRRAIDESGAAVSAEHGFSREEVRAYEEHLLKRLVIDALADDLRRVIRHPLRKLGREERLIGPLLLCEKHGLPNEALCYGIAALLAGCQVGTQEDEQAQRVRRMLEQAGPLEALHTLVGFRPSPAAARQISAAYAQLSARV